MTAAGEKELLLVEGADEDASKPRRRPLAVLVMAVGVSAALLAWVAAARVPSMPATARGPEHDVVQLTSVEKKGGKDEEAAAQPEVNKCSMQGENCSKTQCCSDPGFQCYSKDAGWAQCKADCIEGPDPSAVDGWPWACKKLGPRAEGEAVACSNQGEDCSSSKCCTDPGLQCYEKAPGWASCKAECFPGMDLTDADPNPWSCVTYGIRTPGMGSWVAKQCAASGTACFEQSCCSSAGEICMEQNDYYGECHAEQPEGWSGKTKGARTPPLAMEPWQMPSALGKWVAETCSKIGEDCRKTACCSHEGHQCFEKNESVALCKPACHAGPDLYDADSSQWTCKVLGPATPGFAPEPYKARKNVSEWVFEECGEDLSEDCSKSKCCKKFGSQCFAKNEYWAACSPSCVPGERPGDTGGSWSCDKVGPRTRKPWGKPSLFCFSVVQPAPNYEAALVASQLGTGFGIFGCDEFAVLSVEKFVIGDGPEGPIETITFTPAPVVESKDHTSGNSELFMHVWDAAKALGKYQACDWTVKVDPDAVLLPERLRKHLEPHTGENTYVINCAKPFMPEGPMMFGALECFSRAALDSYFVDVGQCTGNMPWKAYGEDLFMGKCLEMIGVSRTNDFNIYSDGVCRGVDCTDPDAAAFHPKKDPESWNACLEETKNPKPREVTEAPQWFKDYMDSYER